MNNNKIIIKARKYLFSLLQLMTVALLVINVQTVHATQSLHTIYAGIDTVDNTAFLYDKDFVQLLDNPQDPKSSIILLPEAQPLWFVSSSVDIVRRNKDGSIDVLSNNPAYYEMIHHIVLAYSSDSRTRETRCGISLLLGVGSELTNFSFPKGYGYKLDGGVLMPFWHWENPAKVDVTEKLYLRFNVMLDDELSGYKNTNVDWIDAGTDIKSTTCDSAFSIPPGKSKKVSVKYPVKTDRRIIAVVPHIHDHGDEIKLKNNHGTVREFQPEYQNISVAHDDRGQGPTLWHKAKKHLPVNGLYNWTPGRYGPVIKAGDSLWVETKYNNPHPIDIDNMLIAIIYWEAL